MNMTKREPKSVKLDGKKKYVVVSYSHKDVDIVYKELCALEDQKASFWYDRDNKTGEDWLENITNQIDNIMCVGIIIFVSKYSLASPSVTEELKYISENYEKNNLTLFVVLVDHENLDTAISLSNITRAARKIVANEYPEEEYDARDEAVTRNSEYIKEFTNNGNKLFGRACAKETCPIHNASDECVNSINPPCHYKKSLIAKLKELNALTNISFDEDDIEKEKEVKKLIINDSYNRKPIKWIYIGEDGKEKYFVSNTILEYEDTKHLKTALEKIKKSLIIAKTNDKWEFVNNEEGIRLLTFKEYEENRKTLEKEFKQSEDKDNNQMYWWISDKKKYRLVLPDGYVSNNKLYDVEKMGVRPVITLKEKED